MPKESVDLEDHDKPVANKEPQADVLSLFLSWCKPPLYWLSHILPLPKFSDECDFTASAERHPVEPSRVLMHFVLSFTALILLDSFPQYQELSVRVGYNVS